MLENILHERHQEHRRDHGAAFVLLFKGHADAMPDSDLFKGDVVLEKFDLGCESDLLLGALVNKITHDIGEAADQQGGAGRFAEGFIVNIVEGIEQKMRLDLGLEEVELGEALLFQHLLGLTFDPEVIDRDAEDEAHHKDEQAGTGEVEYFLSVERLLHLGEEIVVHREGQPGAANREYKHRQRGNNSIRDCLSLEVKPGKKEGDIPIDDHGVGESIYYGICGREAKTIGEVGEEGEQQYKGPDEEL